MFFFIYLRLIPSSNERNTTGTYFITVKRAMLIDDLASSMKLSNCAKSDRKELHCRDREPRFGIVSFPDHEARAGPRPGPRAGSPSRCRPA